MTDGGGLVSAILSPKEDNEAPIVYNTCIISVSTLAMVMVTALMLLSPRFSSKRSRSVGITIPFVR